MFLFHTGGNLIGIVKECKEKRGIPLSQKTVKNKTYIKNARETSGELG